MNNYYEFTKFDEDESSINLFNSMSDDKLKILLDDYFNEIDDYLNLFADTFKLLFKGKDYDDYYYLAKSLLEQINDIKIILNILVERHTDE